MTKAAELAEFGGGISGGTDAVSGVAKAWAFFEWSGGLTAEDSLNVSSVDDDGAGDFGVNYTSAMADAHHALHAFSTITSGNTYVYGFGLVKATTSAELLAGRHYNGGTTVTEDPETNEFSVHGDLA